MLLKLIPSKQFKKDLKLLRKNNHFKQSELNNVLEWLRQGKRLPAKYKDHALSGYWDGYRDCHVQNDIVLFYRIENGVLHLTRLHTHANFL